MGRRARKRVENESNPGVREFCAGIGEGRVLHYWAFHWHGRPSAAQLFEFTRAMEHCLL